MKTSRLPGATPSMLGGLPSPLALALVLTAMVSSPALLDAQTAASATSDGLDPVARLQEALTDGRETLAYDTAWGYLPALLETLEIPVSSQGLVFSRTSLQTDRIATWAPRAVYFNDDVYVGGVQEGPILEIATVDPDDGARFYTLAQRADGTPRFQEETTTCLMCHESKLTGGVPGFLMLSTLADRSGYPVTEFHAGSTTHATPVEDRWGGWYVTGDAGEQGHAGNIRSERTVHEIDDRARHLAGMHPGPETATDTLDAFFYTGAYLTPHSDVVALLVLTHQVHVHNLISAAAHEAQEAMRDQRAIVSTTGRVVPDDGYLPATRVRLRRASEELVQGLLLADEAPLEGPVRGTSGFRQDFEERGPFDARGRSLRELDLQTRLFRWPMSFLIYSDAFAALPEVVKEQVFARLESVLSGREGAVAYVHLTPDQRATIQEILLDTHAEYRGWVEAAHGAGERP